MIKAKATYKGNPVLWVDFYREDTVPGEDAPWVFAWVDMGDRVLRGFFRQTEIVLEAA